MQTHDFAPPDPSIDTLSRAPATKEPLKLLSIMERLNLKVLSSYTTMSAMLLLVSDFAFTAGCAVVCAGRDRALA